MEEQTEIKKVSFKLYMGIAGAMVVLFWGWWALEHFTDFRISRRGSNTRDEGISVMVAAAATPLSFVVAYFWRRKDAGIAENGVLVDALIEKLGAGSSGMRDATITYTVSGVSYTVKKSISSSAFEGKQVCDTIKAVADLRKPKRVIVQD